MQTVMKRTRSLFGNIRRMKNSRKIKSVMLGIMDAKGRRGGPNREWIDDIKEWCNKDLYRLTIIICTSPKTLETNDEICVGHLRAFSPWIVMMMMMMMMMMMTMTTTTMTMMMMSACHLKCSADRRDVDHCAKFRIRM